MNIKVIVFGFIVLLMFSCTEFREDVNIIGDINDYEELIQLSKWKIFDLYEENIHDTVFTSPLAKKYAIEDSLVKIASLHDFRSFCTSKNDSFCRNFVISKDIKDIEAFCQIPGDTLYHQLFCTFVGCVIKSTVEQDVMLITGCTGGIKCWVNGQQAFENDAKRVLDTYMDFNLIRLKKGENIVILKLDSKRWYDWKLYAYLGNKNIATQKYFENYSSYFLSKVFYNINDSLKINIPVLYDDNVKININQKYPENKVFEKDTIINQKCNLSLNGYKSGYYECKIQSGKYVFRQNFYIGNFKNEIDTLIKESQIFVKDNNHVKNNINPLITRINYLFEYEPHKEYQWCPNYLKFKKYFFAIQVSKNKALADVINGSSSNVFEAELNEYFPNPVSKIEIIFNGNSSDLQNSIEKIRLKDNSGNNITIDTITCLNHNNLIFKQFYGPTATSLELPNGKDVRITLSFKPARVKTLNLEFKKDYEDYTDVLSWQHKTLFVMNELKGILFDLQQKMEAFYCKPGIHIKEFISDIDNQPQQYTLIIPDSIKEGEKIPLIIMPPVSGTFAPFLKSVAVTDHLKNEYLSYLSSVYKMAVITMAARGSGTLNIHPVAIADFFQSIGDANKYVPIDQDKLYLRGGCNEAQFCLQMAVKYPSKFAALGLIFPSVVYSQNDCPENWTDINQPLNYIENLYNMPVNLIHSEDDEHTGFDNSLLFNKMGKEKNVEINFEKLKKITFYNTYPYDILYESHFTFFKSCKSDKSPTKVVFSTSQIKYNTSYWVQLDDINTNKKAEITAEFEPKNNTINFTSENVNKLSFLLSELKQYKQGEVKVFRNKQLVYEGKPVDNKVTIQIDNSKPSDDSHSIINKSKKEGPIVDFFGSNFTVIIGTSSNVQEYAINEKIALQFDNQWNKEYFVHCKIIKDVDADNSLLSNSNLLFIGNNSNNMIINNLLKDIPVGVTENNVMIGQQKIPGKLNFAVLYPNPLNNSRYIIWMGTNDVKQFSLPTENFSKQGWYDYIVWTESRVIIKDCFDDNWQ